MKRQSWALATLLLAAGTASSARPSADLPLGPALGPRLADFVQTRAGQAPFKAMPPLRLTPGRRPKGIVVSVDLAAPRQTLEGIGSALTESSAYVLAQLPRERREEILDRCFGTGGARFTMTRTPIGACDFSVTGRFSYDDVPGDESLSHFSLAPDKRGFPGAEDPGYALLPLLKDALSREPGLKIVASPWSAPSWMKDNQDWYGKGSGGKLLPRHYGTYARYLARYVQAVRAEGVPIWGLTPINEPVGNGGQWESMEFPAESLRDFIRKDLGPEWVRQGLSSVKILQFDHNRDANALQYAQTILGDPEAAAHVWGTAVHWYSSTRSVKTEVLDEIHRRFPAKAILHTEGCIDGIATQECSPGGRFLGWQQDAWWWQAAATDWGFYYAAPEDRPDHPKYAPVARYARDLIEGLNHHFAGWIDWNLVLDSKGGPNHVNNLCGAPIMVDTARKEVYYTPLYYVMAHFSRYLQPGDRILPVSTRTPGLEEDAFHATAALSRDGRHLTVIAFNNSPKPFTYTVQIQGRQARVEIPAQALQSIRLPLAGH